MEIIQKFFNEKSIFIIIVIQNGDNTEVIQNGDNIEDNFSSRIFVHNYPNSSIIEALFGFDIKPLHDACLQVDFSFLNNNNKTKRKKPLDEITSNSQQNKQFNSFGKDAYDNINKIITKHRLTNSINQQIVYVCNIELEYNGNQVFIKFNPTTNQARLDAVVCACDKALLDHDGYLNLAAVVPNIYHEYLVAERRNEINEIINSQIHIKTFNTNNESSEQYTEDDFDKINSNILVEDVEVGNGVFCSISTLLKVLIPFWKSGEKPVITVGDTLRIKLGGNEVLKPEHQFSICLYIGKEKYETLATVCKIFDSQITSLKAHGIIDNDNIHWPVEFYFSDDWKFTSIIMSLNAPNSTYFCLYWKKNPSLFTSIELLNYVPDELRILLQITDVLMECLFKDLNNNRSASWTWTSLMGPEKKKILQSFPMSEFVTGSHGIAIENLWYQFFNLYEMLRKPSYNEEDIIKFELEAKNWVRSFCQPTLGITNSTSAIPGLYRKEDVTSYMHILTMHVPFFLHKLNNQGLSFRLFSTSSIEKKIYEQVKLFFGGTTMRGGNKTKSVVYDMMVFENRQIFYLLNKVPKEITLHKGKHGKVSLCCDFVMVDG
ncbi:219_t:CDS:10 [Entrophospora sp. SA101]|nr:219_t:CDS:10 [Entrophospora sp. SA101]